MKNAYLEEKMDFFKELDVMMSRLDFEYSGPQFIIFVSSVQDNRQ
jgi:hypothetical protein